MTRRIGYARPNNDREAARQRAVLHQAGVQDGDVFVDDPAQRSRPQLRVVLAQCRRGDTLVLPTLRAVGGTAREVHRTTTVLHTLGVRLEVDGTVFDPTDPTGEVFFTTIALLAGIEHTPSPRRNPTTAKTTTTKTSNVTSINTPRMQRKATTLDADSEQELLRLHRTGEFTATELAARFRVSRSTVYRITERYAREHRNPT